MGDAVVTMFTADSAELAHQDRHAELAADPAPALRTGGDGSAMDSSRDEGYGAGPGLSFGRRLRRERMRRRWTQLRLAQRMRQIAVNRGGTAELRSLTVMISKWENGLKEPNEYNRHLLAAALGIPVADLGLPEDPDFCW
ncbi:helix-turn-helix domain-containing protein [Actinoplanes aureus]|uniref:Helix-turn-helix transcriptional regulator n=1 Tax=Actinoplanes aureus TaxID=2792083 RepID=A0A931CI35_9ACTN|nr:helix-turn-helix transcriptional regulator [Actinoplanes aureus]MBG0567546.1 helix-turn-helix transcriptional regulator [Actinoplanes aureus]